MRTRLVGLFVCVLCAVPVGIVHGGGEDGTCTVELSLSAELTSQLEDIFSETTSGFGPSKFGIAAPFTTNSPVADGVIGAGEYPNVCHFSFDDDENPGNPYPGLEPVDDDSDMSLDLHMAHTDEFLFFGFEVTDEFIDVEEDARAWNNDGVELFMNADLEIGDGKGATLEAYNVVGDVTGDGDLELNNRNSSVGDLLVPVSEGPPADDDRRHHAD